MFRTLAGFVCLVSSYASAAHSEDNWFVQEHADRMSGSKISWYVTETAEDFDCTSGRSSAQLFVSCEPGGIRAMIATTDCTFPAESSFRFKTPDNEASRGVARAQSNANHLYLGTTSDKLHVYGLMQSILKGGELLIEAKPLASTPALMAFDTAGLEDMLGEEFDACLQ